MWWASIAFVVGVLFLSQLRAGLIDARVQSLVVQGEIIASAIAASATVETDGIAIDPERLLELQNGESYGPPDEQVFGLEFPINPERVAPVLRRLISPTHTRARIYGRDGTLIVDSGNLYGRGDVLRFDLPPPNAVKPGFLERAYIGLRKWFSRGDLPPYRELGLENGKGDPGIFQALNGQKAHVVSMNDRGEVIVSVAVPIQRFRTVRGALLLSTQGGDIDQIIAGGAAGQILKVAASLPGLSSFFRACSLAPLHSRSVASPKPPTACAGVSSRGSRFRIITRRRDEIGDLSGTLRAMTDALYSRIEAIERFAADVAHELKNPLTSLRSAVETLPLAKSEESRGRLLAVIKHDVRRLDRLISDISDASRLDAELQRQDAAPVDLSRLLKTVVGVANEVQRDGIKVALSFEGSSFVVPGHDLRLGQVINNLVDNARSFSPKNGVVRVTCRRSNNAIEITVDDDGPGIRPDALEKIFDRFYTDRPQQDFGQNSGLGSLDLEADRGGAWRPPVGREPHEPGRPRRSAPASRCTSHHPRDDCG